MGVETSKLARSESRMASVGDRANSGEALRGRVDRIDSRQSLPRCEVGLIGSTRDKASLGVRSG